MLPAVPLAQLIKFCFIYADACTPEGYEHTQFPATHLLPIIPTPGGHDDIQHLMTLSLHHWCTSSRALHAV